MTTQTIAILMPGDMGAGVGRALCQHGHRVVSTLAERSDATRARAADAGIEDAGSLDEVVHQAGLILSILPPADALGLAESVAGAIGRTGARPVYVDCNAVSPATARAAGGAVTGAGGAFIDAGIIGLKPDGGPGPRIYVSGPDTGAMEALDGCGFQVRPIGAEPGRASAMKMCYAGLTKGTWTLHAAVLLAAEAQGLSAELADEFRYSQAATYEQMRARIPRLPADSGRWIGEMEEIAKSFADAGVPSGFHEGAAAIFRLLAETPFAAETRETLDPNRTLEETIAATAEQLNNKKP